MDLEVIFLNKKKIRGKKTTNKLDKYTMTVIMAGVVSMSVAMFSILSTVTEADSIRASDNSSSMEQSSQSAENSQNDESSALPENEKEDEHSSATGDIEVSASAPSSQASATAQASSGAQSSQAAEPEAQTVEKEEPPAKTYTAKNTAATIGTSGVGNIPSWQAKNSDVVGWIKIPNTNIDYPVVVGPDNLYYEALGYDKQADKNGVIWADSDTYFGGGRSLSKNNVLYGHNWTNVTNNPRIGNPNDVMFAQLASFHHLDFAQNTPYIYYSTENTEMVWQIFAVFYTEIDFNYIMSDGSSDYMSNVISEAKARSLHNYDVSVNSSDKILTLSTCTRAYGSSADQRYVVMAKLMDPSEAIVPVTITENADFKKPTL